MGGVTPVLTLRMASDAPRVSVPAKAVVMVYVPSVEMEACITYSPFMPVIASPIVYPL